MNGYDKMYLQSTLPAASTLNQGVTQLSSVELEIGGQKIDKHTSMWNRVWSDLTEYNPGGFFGELEQTQLVLGIEGLNNIDVDRYSLRALAIILGGGMSSRLFQEIREKRGEWEKENARVRTIEENSSLDLELD